MGEKECHNQENDMKYSKQQMVTYFKSVAEMLQTMMALMNSSYLMPLLVSFLFQKEKRKQTSGVIQLRRQNRSKGLGACGGPREYESSKP